MVQVTGSRWPRPSYSLLVTGLARVTLDRVVQESPFPVGEVTQIEVPLVEAEGPLQSRMVTFKEKAMELLELLEGSRPAVRRIKVGKMQGCDIKSSGVAGQPASPSLGRHCCLCGQNFLCGEVGHSQLDIPEREVWIIFLYSPLSDKSGLKRHILCWRDNWRDTQREGKRE